MSKNRNFLTYLAQAVVQYKADQQAVQLEEQNRPSRLSRFLRWLTPNGGTLLLVLTLVVTANVWAKPLLGTTSVPGPSATTINYQGRLADNAGNPLDGTYGMNFALYDAPTDGNLVWGPESHTAVAVSDGLFSVGLGSQTSGGIPTSVWDGDIYLEITVSGETLEPRELIRSVPIAGMALTVPDGSITRDKFSSEINPVSLYLFDAPITVIDSSGYVEPTQSWNLLDLSENVPVDAQAVILTILVDVDHENDGEFRLGFRRPGSEALAYQVLAVDGHYTPGHVTWTHNQGIVGVNDGQVEWTTQRPTGTTQGKYIVTLVGYYY